VAIRVLRAILVIAVLAYAAAVVGLRVSEKGLVYHPAERRVQPPPSGLHVREVAFPSEDSTRLTAWIVPAVQADSSGYWLLVCHGNYGNIGYGQRPVFYEFVRAAGLSLLAFDYRGFGASAGSPSEQGLYADARASYHFLTDSLRVPPDRIILFGHSLGSGVAIELATEVPAAALVVEGAYTSVPARGQELYPWFPVMQIATQRFPSIDRIARVHVPVLFLHSPEDEIIPFVHGRRLYAAANEPRRFVPVRGGHMDAFEVDSGTYFGAITDLVRSLPHAAPTPAAPAAAPVTANR
jgi:uncharacterized protein